MYYCEICGREMTKKIRRQGMTLCYKHAGQITVYGRVLDNNPRSCKDDNGYRIEGDVTYVDLYDRQQNKNNEFMIDTEDLDKIKHHKWRLSWGRVVTGNSSTTKTSLYLTHVILGIESTDYDNKIDHIDGNPLNNCKSNLRVCTQGENLLNKHFMSNNSTGVVGVYPETREGRKSNYCAEIRYEYKRYHIGAYITLEEAAYARYVAQNQLFKEFSNNENFANIDFNVIPLQRRKDIEQYVLNKINAA